MSYNGFECHCSVYHVCLYFPSLWLRTWCCRPLLHPFQICCAFQSLSFITFRSLRYITCGVIWSWCPPCRRSWWHVLPTSGCMYTSGTAWAWSPSCSPSMSTIFPTPTCSTVSRWLVASRMTNSQKFLIKFKRVSTCYTCCRTSTSGLVSHTLASIRRCIALEKNTVQPWILVLVRSNVLPLHRREASMWALSGERWAMSGTMWTMSNKITNNRIIKETIPV